MADCSATPAAIRLVEDVARAARVRIRLETVLVKTQEQAKTLAFLGSPTMQVNGRDIEPEAQARTDFGLT